MTSSVPTHGLDVIGADTRDVIGADTRTRQVDAHATSRTRARTHTAGADGGGGGERTIGLVCYLTAIDTRCSEWPTAEPPPGALMTW